MHAVAPTQTGFSAERLRRIDTAMRRFVDTGLIVGAVTLIARHGETAYLGSAGVADVDAGTPMRPDAVFQIASMTKPVATVAALMLLEEGCFWLDEPIADFIPEFAQTKVFVGETTEGMALADLERPITIRHLMTHTSGLTYGNTAGTVVERMYSQQRINRQDETLEDGIPRLAAIPLSHQPGSAWTYGIGHNVLARLVEVVSGSRFDAFLRGRIFGPLAMEDTGFRVPARHLDRFAPVYARDASGSLKRDDSYRLGRAEARGSGGLYSTACDYARFLEMLRGGGELDGVRLLGRKTVELMTADHLPRNKSPFPPTTYPFDVILAGQGFGLGGSVTVRYGEFGTPRSVGSYAWGGGAGSHVTTFWIDPKEDLVGLIMLQTLVAVQPLRRIEGLVYQALE